MDFGNLIKEMPAVDRSQAKIGVFTDPNVAKLPVMEIVEESLLREGLDFVVWDKCAVEPTDKSWQVSLKLQVKGKEERGISQIQLTQSHGYCTSRKQSIFPGLHISLISWPSVVDLLWTLLRLPTCSRIIQKPTSMSSSTLPLAKVHPSLRNLAL